ncbi:MAG: hypothetical protein IPJ29_12720 [Chitinophagaceae bacterium]|nr:hypothetical protein [Chitinophagaceae bacterium]
MRSNLKFTSDVANIITPTTPLIAAYERLRVMVKRISNHPMNFNSVDELGKMQLLLISIFNTKHSLEKYGHHISKEYPGVSDKGHYR